MNDETVDLRTMAGAILRIDLDALVHNYRLIQARVAPSSVAAVVKADAYGLGAREVAGALSDAGCSHFFVAHLSEAIELRAALSPSSLLYVLNGLQPGSEAACTAAGAIPVLNSLDQLDRWSHHAGSNGVRLPAVLQVDTGMSRLGMPPKVVDALLSTPDRLANVDLTLLMSHLACADEPAASANPAQYAAFCAIADRFPGVPRSLDNSGGAFLPHDRHFDIVRAGVALFGGAPQQGSNNPMQPVVSLDARIIQVREIPTGTGVGYGLSFRADRPSRIATIAVGYADGWPRHLSGRGSAFVGGTRVPIVGRVSMDSITLDVTDVSQAVLYPGAPVELLGPQQGIDDVAADAGTISYEILTQLGRRYARDYLPVREARSQGSEKT